MMEKIVLRWRGSPKIVTLPNGTTFTARSERISRKQLLRNIKVKNSREIGPRNRNKSKMGPGPTIPPRKKVRFLATSSTQDRVWRIKKNTKNWQKDNLAKD